MFLTNALLIDGKKKPFSSYLSHSSSVQNTCGSRLQCGSSLLQDFRSGLLR